MTKKAAEFRATDSVEVFDVDGSELIPVALSRWNDCYSKFRSVYVVFKSDQWALTKNQEMGIFVQYSAVRKGKALMGYKQGEEERETPNKNHHL